MDRRNKGSMTKNLLAKLFIQAVESGEIIRLLGEASFPNLPLRTLGGHVFWNELAECDGWRLQKNMIT